MFHSLSDEEFCRKVNEVLNESLRIETDFQIKFEDKFKNSYQMIKQRYKRVKKKTIKTTHEEIRYEYAKRKLKECCCFEVMIELGFKYESSFSRWFRKHSGITPSEYREQKKD